MAQRRDAGIMNFTTVIAVDQRHLEQIRLTWPTWVKHKPNLLSHPLLVIVDDWALVQPLSELLVEHTDKTYVLWEPETEYIQKTPERWFNPQRQKMLSAFTHVPATHVSTPYFLKLDVDTVAVGMDDWIDERWFEGEPAIVASPWGYTKPANQILELDEWVSQKQVRRLKEYPALDYKPNPGSDLVRHKRIISWCGFFNTQFNQFCSEIAEENCGTGQLPVPSQDGFLGYCAERLHKPILRVPMKSFGWKHLSTLKGIREAIKESEGDQI